MTELIVLMLGSEEPIRCASLADAKDRVCKAAHITGKIMVEVTPGEGGPMQTLEFDKQARDWSYA